MPVFGALDSPPPTQAGTRPLVVSMREVSKRYSTGTLALQGMALNVERGEFLSIVGPSGCGKSTVLRIIAGLTAPTAGTISWPSSELSRRGLPEGDIGFVFQDPTLMPWQPVFGNVYLPLKLKGLSAARARPAIMHMLEKVGLADFAEAFPRELSGGMKMRVAIARALVIQPRLLLLDEPFAALDEITRQTLNDDLLGLWRDTGTTVVFVTHSVFESAFLSSRIAVMTPRPGRVHADLSLDAPIHRDAAYRSSAHYRSIIERVSHALQEAMALGGALR